MDVAIDDALFSAVDEWLIECVWMWINNKPFLVQGSSLSTYHQTIILFFFFFLLVCLFGSVLS
jgi:hypothetical protein